MDKCMAGNDDKLNSDPFEDDSFRISWHIHVLKPSIRSKIRWSLGLCECSKGVAFLSVTNPDKQITDEGLKPLMIHDVHVDKEKKRCEDEKWCWNLSCPCNHADVSQFTRYGIKKHEELERFHKTIEKIKDELKLEILDRGMSRQYDKPLAYFTKK